MSAAGKDSARGLALRVLIGTETAGQYSALALDHALERSALPANDRALATRLVYGVLEKKILLLHILAAFSDRAPDTLDAEVRVTLLLGLYQLLFLDRIPVHAAVDETVRLAPRPAKGFVNAVLRSFLRVGKTYRLPDAGTDPVGYLSLVGSVPAPLAARLLSIYGFQRTESLLAAFSDVPPLTLRVNTIKISRPALIEAFAAQGIAASPTRFSPDGVTVASGAPAAFPGFAEGWFFVQDEASQIAVAALDAQPGDTVIDTCACPGSKSFGAAIGMQNRGRVCSYDLHENKLSLVRASAQRLGITILTAEQRDGRSPDPALSGQADRVLVDAPCSGYGVIAKKPEIRFKDPASAAGLPAVQAAILNASAGYVKPGGVLVYSTCTLLPEENDGVADGFLAAHPEFSPEGFAVGDLRVPGGRITLAPDTHKTDGFFVAKFRRK